MSQVWRQRPDLVPPPPLGPGFTAEMQTPRVLRPEFVLPTLKPADVPAGIYADNDPHKPQEA